MKTYFLVEAKLDAFLISNDMGYVLFGNASNMSLISGGSFSGMLTGAFEILNNTHYILSAGYGYILRVCASPLAITHQY